MLENQNANEVTERLRAIAPHVNYLVLDEQADSEYELLAGAIIWDDEFPPSGTVSHELIDSLKAVLRYRTTLILGLPDAQYERAWSTALELFPLWPGFCPARRVGSLKERVIALRAAATRGIDELFDPE